MGMKKQWEDPVKRPASEATMQTKGDFAAFTDTMRRLAQVKPSDLSRAAASKEKKTA